MSSVTFSCTSLLNPSWLSRVLASVRAFSLAMYLVSARTSVGGLAYEGYCVWNSAGTWSERGIQAVRIF